MAGKKGMRQREKVMYDPYNFAAVTEKFRQEQEAERKKGRGPNKKPTKKAFEKVKQNQRKITTELSKQIESGQKQLDKQAKRLDQATVTGPLDQGKIKIKTLKKITGGAPGLNKGPRSKMYIGKKFSEGGSNMDYEKEKKKIKKKTEPLSIMGAGTPLRMLGRYFLNKERKKQRKKELAALPMKVDDFKQDHMRNKSIGEVEDFAKRVRREVGLPEPKTKGMKFDRVRKNMGGVIKNRGGTFKGVF